MSSKHQGKRDLWTLIEAAARLGMSAGTLRAQIHRGRLVARKLGRDWVVDNNALSAYEREVRRKPPSDRKLRINEGNRMDPEHP